MKKKYNIFKIKYKFKNEGTKEITPTHLQRKLKNKKYQYNS